MKLYRYFCILTIALISYINCSPSNFQNQKNHTNASTNIIEKTDDTALLFVLAGQSNMGFRDLQEPFDPSLQEYLTPPENVKVYNVIPFENSSPAILLNNENYAHENGGNFTAAHQVAPFHGFVHQISQIYPNKKIIVLVMAIPATYVDQWAISGGGTCYTAIGPSASTIVDLGNKLISHINDVIKREGGAIDFKGLIWYQGESDAVKGCANYEERLMNFFTELKEQGQWPSLQFVITEIYNYLNNSQAMNVPFNQNYMGIYSIRSEQEALNRDYNIPLVNVDDLSLGSDFIHLDGPDAIKAGIRMAETYLNSYGNLSTPSPTPSTPTPTPTPTPILITPTPTPVFITPTPTSTPVLITPTPEQYFEPINPILCLFFPQLCIVTLPTPEPTVTPEPTITPAPTPISQTGSLKCEIIRPDNCSIWDSYYNENIATEYYQISEKDYCIDRAIDFANWCGTLEPVSVYATEPDGGYHHAIWQNGSWIFGTYVSPLQTQPTPIESPTPEPTNPFLCFFFPFLCS